MRDTPLPHTIHIRDSKHPTGSNLVRSPTAWTTLLSKKLTDGSITALS
ncbi:DUF397 domain-containing protein [Streptomyces phaeolivaceus]|uniref:DUF397 domain-containing protein n=1 Tax=Streptomyces phaeolivaceus TaxID=2653200 RepID=A0A5P8KIR1_9ACTN|nr:DUF397 domain-containing protein [Streptomyces phaeolivaceus]QFR02905.1 DUF397 domain-containing protein [Streptomyces phaeolivaceus]